MGREGASKGTSPAVALGEAREDLQRALLFGSTAEIELAQLRVDQARDRQADGVRAEHSEFIDELLSSLPEQLHGDPPATLVELAVRGEFLATSLIEAYVDAPGSIGLTDPELTFVRSDPRRIRAVVLARRSHTTFDQLVASIESAEDDESSTYALAARSDGAILGTKFVRDASFQEWVTDYTKSEHASNEPVVTNIGDELPTQIRRRRDRT